MLHVGNTSLLRSGNVNVAITDIQGKTIWESNNTSEKIISLPVQKFAAGTYFVTITNDNQ